MIEEKNNINENSIFSREVAVTHQRRGDRRTEREREHATGRPRGEEEQPELPVRSAN